MSNDHGTRSTGSGDNPIADGVPGRWRKWLGRVFIVIGVVSTAVVLVAGTVVLVKTGASNRQQEQVAQDQAPFYTYPDSVPTAPGTIIKSEPVGYSVVGGQGFRIVYVSQDSAGKAVPVSGLVFVPTAPAPPGGRKVLAWAHGTVGLASKCAPSRKTEPIGSGWLEPALAQGWLVAATDYLGLGIDGPKSFLVGGQEARDVTNSVRAAAKMTGAEASNDWIVWGASQGGHSALWTGADARKIAPELSLRAVGAAAPAAELAVIMREQWNQTVGWAIGPEAIASWSANYPGRDFTSIMTAQAKNQYDALGNKCVLGDGLTGLVEEKFDNSFFAVDPNSNADFAATVAEQTPRALPPSLPLFVAQGTDDTVVLQGSNALLQQQWCAAGVTMQMDWLGGVQHQNTQNAGGPAFIEWAVDRFAGKPAPKNCAFSPPAPTVAFKPVTPVAPTQ
ncbi:MAG: lipase family protein [Actinomycetes bacterium]